MDGHGEARANAMMKCAEAAWDMGLKIFALQNGGECMGERDGERKYMKYGMFNLCHGQYCMAGSHYTAKKKVDENKLEKCFAAHIVQRCQQYCLNFYT